MYARHRLDISVGQLLFALGASLVERDEAGIAERIEKAWSGEGDALVCLSVRSGFDLLLQALALPPGSEILVSAVTIPDMVRVIEGHGLRAIPVDLDLDTLAPSLQLLERAVSERSRAILVAHLFGGLVDLAPIAGFARRHDLLLLEDAAQGFVGPASTGDPAADISMFSFGPIKTSTALGGALLRVKDPATLERMRRLHESWPVQSRSAFLTRVVRFLGLTLASRPLAYGLLAGSCRAAGADFDSMINSTVRGFSASTPSALLQRIRRRPCAPLLALLGRRLETFDLARLARRTEVGERASRALPPGIVQPGKLACRRTHWVFPVLTPDPSALVAVLNRNGFDATQASTTIAAVEPPPDRPEFDPAGSKAMLSKIVFLPVYPEVPDREIRRLLKVLSRVGGEIAPGGTL